MGIDERLQFLLQSTELLHASTQELHASMREFRAVVNAHPQQLQTDAENIRTLARITEIHEQRLGGLEGFNGGEQQ